MKTRYILPLSLTVLFTTTIIFSGFKPSSDGEPWRADQLMAPADLAQIINDPKAHQPIVISIGPGAVIKNSIDIGPTKEKANLEKLRQELEKLSKESDVVIYCGCCPFDHCPNIRPAFSLMNEMKFTHHMLLSLPKNVKADWIDKGYPLNN